MTRPWLSSNVEPCLWMAAGLINYKLCDRDFDCDHCPLHAALRGDSPQEVPERGQASLRPPADSFPDDRCYSTGHLWVQLIDRESGTGRLGLDAFAASLISRLIELRFPPQGTGHVAELRLESGSLSLTLPIHVDVTEPNPRLHYDPDLVLTEPYSCGWLLALANLAPADLVQLLTADQALEQARQDLRLFRRHVALEMLAETSNLGRCMADGGQPLTDLQQMLGAANLRNLLQELIH